MARNFRNVQGHFARVAPWRYIAAADWQKPRDPSIHGALEIDATNAMAWLEAMRDKWGVHVTVNHLVVKALAETFRRHPQANAIIRRGRVFVRDHIDISVLVAVRPDNANHLQRADLSSTMIRNADRRDILSIAREVQRGAGAVREHHDPLLGRTKAIMRFLPPSLLRLALEGAYRAMYDWNVPLAPIIPRDPFGSALVTSVGTFCIGHAFAPIPPFMNIAAILAVGVVEDKAVVRNGEVVVRKILPLSATIDHRVIDGFQGARLSRTLQTILENPARELQIEPVDEAAAQKAAEERTREIHREAPPLHARDEEAPRPHGDPLRDLTSRPEHHAAPPPATPSSGSTVEQQGSD